ncbi:MAG: 30S ribosomal protein S17 [Deltaproteobacteria bacterium]|nr:30S ribosomal protein S17 [Deltaproteobacteria bacterium]
MSETNATESSVERFGGKRVLVGRVMSAKMTKTVVVEVVRSVRHPVYKKYIRVRKRYKAHDEQGQYRAGDMVEIREHRPISKDKHFVVARLLSRPSQS